MSTMRETRKSIKSTFSSVCCNVAVHSSQTARRFRERWQKFQTRVFKATKILIKWLGNNPDVVKFLIYLAYLSTYEVSTRDPDTALNLLENFMKL